MPYPGSLLCRCFSDCYSSLAGTYDIRRHELIFFNVSVDRDNPLLDPSEVRQT